MIRILLTSSLLIVLVALTGKILRQKISSRLLYALWLFPALRLIFPFLTRPYMRSEQTFEASSTMFKAAGMLRRGSERVLRYVSGERIHTVLLTLWFTGMILTAITLFLPFLRFLLTLLKERRSMITTKDGLLGISVSNLVTTPLLIGWMVFIPQTISEDANKYRFAIEHERTHLRHLDPLWNIVRTILLIIFWYDPFVWMAAVLSKKDSEYACDEALIKCYDPSERAEYCRVILEIASGQHFVSLTGTAGSGMADGKLLHRITLIMQEKKNKLYAFAAAFAFLLFIFIFTLRPVKAESINALPLITPAASAVGSYYDSENPGVLVTPLPK